MSALAGYSTRVVPLTVLALTAGIFFVGKQSAPSARAREASAHVKVVDLIPASLSGETNQDSEPFLAVQVANPQVMVASAFTPNPISSTGNAPVYVSEDAGNTWVLSAITPVQRMTCDITHAMSIARTIRGATCTRARSLARHPSHSTSRNRTMFRRVPL